MKSLPLELTRDALEAMIATEWKQANIFAAGLALISFFLIGLVWNATQEADLELSDMLVVEGELARITPNVPRSFPTIVLRMDDGSHYDMVSWNSSTLKSLIGEQIKVWSQESCWFSGFMCRQYASQIQYKNRLLVDYEDVRTNRGILIGSKGIKGVLLALFWPALPLLLAIIGFGAVWHKTRKMKKLFKERLEG